MDDVSQPVQMVKVYWKPTCQTCRRVVKALEEKGVTIELYDLTKSPPSKELLKSLAARYGIHNLLRKRSKYYDSKRFKDKSEDELIEMMATNTDLIRRPILVVDGRPVLGDDKVVLGGIRPESGRD
jgi:arsenate reductase